MKLVNWQIQTLKNHREKCKSCLIVGQKNVSLVHVIKYWHFSLW